MSDPHRKRLLVVDDQAAMGDFIAHVAQSLGFEVESFTDARRFLNALDRGVASVVMIDLAMPGMDGVELICKMAEGHSQAAVFIFQRLRTDASGDGHADGRGQGFEHGGMYRKADPCCRSAQTAVALCSIAWRITDARRHSWPRKRRVSSSATRKAILRWSDDLVGVLR